MQNIPPSLMQFANQSVANILSTASDDLSLSIELITGDASFRRYYRVGIEEHSFILMDSPPQKVDNLPFVELNQYFSGANLIVPRILSRDMALGYMLLQDLGSVHLADKLNDNDRLAYYKQIIELLPKIAAITQCDSMKPYDASFIDNEMEIFNEWLVQDMCQLTFDNSQIKMWQQLKQQLCNAMIMQPQVTMHRDFHSRNIMYCESQWALIDYQDAVVGPLTYDLVSLLKDCYFVLPKNELNELLEFAYQLYQEHGLTGSLDFESFCLLFHLTGLQRHIKAAGIFCRLAKRDGKNGYLQNLPDTLNYMIDTAEQLKNQFSVLGYFAEYLKVTLRPQLEAKI